MKQTLKRLFINVATKVNNPMIRDEFFMPKLGLEAAPYIMKGDRTGSHHLLRYEWAVKTISSSGPYPTILDVACGAGYGSYLIARQFPASQVIGVDYDPGAVKIAKSTYILPNLEYRQGDMTRWEETIGPDIFGCITSFDTLEHVSHREIALESLVGHLDQSGSLLFSTPCGADENSLQPAWAYHKIEFSTASLYDFLSRYFRTLISPETPGFPNLEVFDQLKGSKVDYLLRLNPLICKDPIRIENPYQAPPRS